jgi:hypothetical protein
MAGSDANSSMAAASPALSSIATVRPQSWRAISRAISPSLSPMNIVGRPATAIP